MGKILSMHFLHLLLLISFIQLSLQQCSSVCSACINTTCVLCSSNYLLHNNTCVISCPSQYYQVTSTAGSSCQERTYISFKSSLVTTDTNYQLIFDFNITDSNPQFNFSGLVNILIDETNSTTYTISKNTSSRYTATFVDLAIDSVLDRQIFIDTTRLNNDPAAAYTVLANASQTNLTIPGIAGPGSTPPFVGWILGVIVTMLCSLAILMAIFQNLKSGGTNFNLLIISHYSFLFQSLMLMNVKYAPNLTEFYKMMPSCLWNRGQLFQKLFFSESNPVSDSLHTLAPQFARYMTSPAFLSIYDIFAVVLLAIAVIWIPLRVISRLRGPKKSSNSTIKVILDFLEWNFLASVIGGSLPLLGLALFMEYYFLWLSDVFSYFSLIVSLLFDFILIMAFLFLYMAAFKKESISLRAISNQAPVLLEDLSSNPVGIKGLFFMYTRSILISSILVILTEYPVAQTLTIFTLNAIVASIMFFKRIFKSDSLLNVSRSNEILLVLVLSWFVILSFQDSYTFLLPSEEVLIAWVLSGLMLLQASLQLNYQFFDICKKIKISRKRVLRDEEAAAMRAALEEEEHSYNGLRAGKKGGLVVIRAVNALDDSMQQQQLIESSIDSPEIGSMNLSKIILEKKSKSSFELQPANPNFQNIQTTDIQASKKQEISFISPKKSPAKKVLFLETPDRNEPRSYNDVLLHQTPSPVQSGKQGKIIDSTNELITTGGLNGTPDVGGEHNSVENTKNDAERSKLQEPQSEVELPASSQKDLSNMLLDDNKISINNTLLRLVAAPKRQKKVTVVLKP